MLKQLVLPLKIIPGSPLIYNLKLKKTSLNEDDSIFQCGWISYECCVFMRSDVSHAKGLVSIIARNPKKEHRSA